MACHTRNACVWAGDVVNPQQASAALDRGQVHGDRRDIPISGMFHTGDDADEPLPGGTDEYRVAERGERVEAGDQLNVVLRGLAEAEPGIDDDAGYTRGLCGLGPRSEKLHHLGDHVVVAEVAMRVRRVRGWRVHHHHGHRTARGDRDHPWVAEAAHVVDETGTGVHGLLGHSGAAGVDAHEHTVVGKLSDDRHDAVEFLVDADRRSAGPSRFAAHVDGPGTLRDKPSTVLDGRRW